MHPPALRPRPAPPRLSHRPPAHLLGLLAFLSAAPALAAAPGTLSGLITYQDGAAAIDGAVHIGKRRAAADARGLYAITLPPGTYQVRCVAKDAKPRVAKVRIKAGAATGHDCALVRRTPAGGPPPVARGDEDASRLDFTAAEQSLQGALSGGAAGIGGLGTRGSGSGGGGRGFGRVHGMGKIDTGGARRASMGGSGTTARQTRRPRPGQRRAHLAGQRGADRAQRAGALAADRDGHAHTAENPVKSVHREPLSTLSIDVDTASYAQSRGHLNRGNLPPPGAVRVEEFVNYFPYDYPQPAGEHPFTLTVDQARSPFHPERSLVRIGLQGRAIDTAALPPSNLVFLIDVSGSMNGPGRLPLLQQSFKLLVDQLRAADSVAIVVYAGSAGVVLPPTPGDRKAEILAAIDGLRAGGSTAGGAGIHLAYQLASAHYREGGNNRVLLATDGDFNVGVSSEAGLVALIEEKRRTGVFLSVLGFGMGNYQDAKMQQLVQAGNGNGAYIDSLQEARKVLVSQMAGTLHTIAKDVKLQVEFNPARVKAYRLMGYETRALRDEDFNDDRKDAGEMGAGHSVTALYEIVPAESDEGVPGVDPLKYQGPIQRVAQAAHSEELLTVKARYKAPDGETSRLLSQALAGAPGPLREAPRDLRFAAAVAGFAMHLQDSPHKGQSTLSTLADLAGGALGEDQGGYRAELLALIERAATLTSPPALGLAR